MAHGCHELSWSMILLQVMACKQNEPMVLHCDGDSAIKLAKNPVYHEKTKHV